MTVITKISLASIALLVLAVAPTDVKADQPAANLLNSFEGSSTSHSVNNRRPSQEDVQLPEFKDTSKQSAQKTSQTTVDASSNTTQPQGFVSKVTTWFKKLLASLSF